MSPASTTDVPECFQWKPLEVYDLKHHLKNATLLDKVFNTLQNVVEGILVKFSLVGDHRVFESILPKTLESFPEVCLDAAERVEAIRDSGFVDRNDLGRLHALVTERPALRWRLALEIAQSEEILHATSRLTWGGSCIVSFGAPDLPALIARANHSNTPQEARNIWFEVAMNLALRELKGRCRMAVLTELCSGPEMESRAQRIGVLKSERLTGVKQRRQYNGEDRQRKHEKRTAHERDRENLTRDIEYIRDGSHAGTLHWLISYSFNYSGRDCLTRVDFDVKTVCCGRRTRKVTKRPNVSRPADSGLKKQ